MFIKKELILMMYKTNKGITFLSLLLWLFYFTTYTNSGKLCNFKVLKYLHYIVSILGLIYKTMI